MSELDRHLDEVLVGGQRPVVVELSPYEPRWSALFEAGKAAHNVIVSGGC